MKANSEVLRFVDLDDLRPFMSLSLDENLFSSTLDPGTRLDLYNALFTLLALSAQREVLIAYLHEVYDTVSSEAPVGLEQEINSLNIEGLDVKSWQKLWFDSPTFTDEPWASISWIVNQIHVKQYSVAFDELVILLSPLPHEVRSTVLREAKQDRLCKLGVRLVQEYTNMATSKKTTSKKTATKRRVVKKTTIKAGTKRAGKKRVTAKKTTNPVTKAIKSVAKITAKKVARKAVRDTTKRIYPGLESFVSAIADTVMDRMSQNLYTNTKE